MRRAARPWPILVTVEGLNLGRFIRRAGEAKIQLNDLHRKSSRKMTALVQEDSLPPLQQIAMEGGWTLHTGERNGTGRLVQWVYHRRLLVMAAMMIAVILLFCMQVMWQVEIIGAGAYEADISRALEEAGINPPMLRRQVNLGELRDTLSWRYPRIAWFECGWRGTALVISVVEGTLPRRDTDNTDPCDVVAARDAIVHSIVTYAGTPVVKAGDLVHQGDVLIKGEERTSDGGMRPVAASGEVTGRVWLGASIELALVEAVTQYTGNQQHVWTVRTPWFDLWKMQDCEYDQYDIKVSERRIAGIFLPVKLHEETRLEAEVTKQKRDFEETSSEARAAALRKLHEKLAPGESLIDIWGNCSMIDNEKVRADAIGEMLMEIGLQQVSPGMAAPGE